MSRRHGCPRGSLDSRCAGFDSRTVHVNDRHTMRIRTYVDGRVVVERYVTHRDHDAAERALGEMAHVAESADNAGLPWLSAFETSEVRIALGTDTSAMRDPHPVPPSPLWSIDLSNVYIDDLKAWSTLQRFLAAWSN